MKVAKTLNPEILEKVDESIRNSSQAMCKAALAGKAEVVAQFFHENAYFKLPGQKPVTGRDAIFQMHGSMFEQGMRVRFETKQVTVTGDNSGIELGLAKIMKPDGEVALKASYMSLWVEEEGEWRILQDIVSAFPES